MLWLKAPLHLYRLARAGLALARAGLPQVLGLGEAMPAPLRRLSQWLAGDGEADIDELSRTLTILGPSYIKLGQFLATRPDIIGMKGAAGLASLQDRLDPFAASEAEAEIERELKAPLGELFSSLGPPVAAASIAQVHYADLNDGPITGGAAVKVLRPGVERRFTHDLEGFYLA
ncbi:MAG: hypothetical protein HKN60_07510, partial [Rhizobiales bacterium]|nr:hypothetical protein [Hyphomicrobiales bacterium]